MSDSYEPVDEFLGNVPDSNERRALLATPDDRKTSRTAPPSPHTRTAAVSMKTNRTALPSPSKEMKESLSLDRKLSMDNQYIEVMSPARKVKSLKPRSAGATRDEVDVTSPELDYQNVIPGRVPWGNGNVTGSVDNLHRGHRSSPGEHRKSPLSTPKKTSPKPKPKPKPHPSQIPPNKPRSKSHDSGMQMSTQQQMRIVGGQSTNQEKKRPHLEEMVFPAHPVANGNIHRGDVTMGNRGGDSDSRWRSTTVPVGGGGGGGGEEGEEEGGEMLYVNVGDVGGEELYENVTHDHLT